MNKKSIFPGKGGGCALPGGGIGMYYTFLDTFLSIELENVKKKVFFWPNTRKTKKIYIWPPCASCRLLQAYRIQVNYHTHENSTFKSRKCKRHNKRNFTLKSNSNKIMFCGGGGKHHFVLNKISTQWLNFLGLFTISKWIKQYFPHKSLK